MPHSPLIYLTFAAAVIFEVLGTSALQRSQQFTAPGPTAMVVLCYGAAFYLLSHTLQAIPVGLAYAMWSGMGIVLISAVGYFWFRQTLDLPAVLGIAMIVAGVVIINVFSRSVAH